MNCANASPFCPPMSTLQEAVERASTPCYVYFEGELLRNVRHIRETLPTGAGCFFALMANDNPHILKAIGSHGFGMFAGSVHNLERILAHNLTDGGVTFAPTGLSNRAIDLLCEYPNGIAFANSLNQLRMLVERTSCVCGLRINMSDIRYDTMPNIAEPHFNGIAERIGVSPERAVDFIRSGDQLVSLLQGFHVYAGTNRKTLDGFLSTYRTLLCVAEQHPRLSVIDFGGGFPSTAQFPRANSWWSEWRSKFNQLLSDVQAIDWGSVDILFEVGRAVVASCAFFVTEVLDIIEGTDVSTLICDGDMSSFPRPYLYSAASDEHPVTLARKPTGQTRPYRVTGSTTYSLDLLHRGCLLPEVSIGDRLVFANAGAYSASMSLRFLGAPPPTEVLVTDNRILDISVGRNHGT